jgi:N-acylneuraminate cytidylyltransferase
MGNIVAIIPARAGSKGIPSKNLKPICGLPLVAWSIIQALNATHIDSVWVSSDSKEILSVAEHYGAKPILRPAEFSGDEATSESAWLHALNEIESTGQNVDWIIGMQPTSPIRESSDLDLAIEKVKHEQLDTLLSVAEIEDFFTWRITDDGPESVNYDYQSRKLRQKLEKRYLENGSFYIISPEILRLKGNRLGGQIGLFVMERYKMFQIDNPQDVILCESILRGYGLDVL